MLWNFVVIFFLINIPLVGLSQNCIDFHIDACKPPTSKYSYTYNQNSVSYLFKPGEKKQVPLSLYSGKDYRITICSQDGFTDVVAFKIVKANGTVFYENSKYDYELNLEFSSKQNQDVIIEVEIPDISDTDNLIIQQGCVGVLIEEMISVKTGF